MIKLAPYMAWALLAAVGIIGFQQWRIKAKNEDITRLEVRIESIQGANEASMDVIRKLEAANKQCALDNLSNSKLNNALSEQHQAHVVTLNEKLNHAKEQIKDLGESHCANTAIGDAYSLLPRN